MIELNVYGTPAPQGSKRHVGRGILVESSKAVQPWREAIVSEALRSNLHGVLLPGALVVRITFYLTRPKGHSGAHGIKPSAPRFPDRKPDLDKLVRSTLDGLAQASIYGDDAQVTTIHAAKRYADTRPPGAAITIHPEEQVA